LVVSCIATILLGAWIAIHPNIASPRPARDSNGKHNLNPSESSNLRSADGQNNQSGPHHSNGSDVPENPRALQTRGEEEQDTNKLPHLLKVFFLERLPLYFLFLLVPEYILGWAIRQYCVAKDIAKQNGTRVCVPTALSFLSFSFKLDKSRVITQIHELMKY
jgi:hypothetical protein